MTYLEAIIFAVVQGITEFLPISSTAHIVITQYLLGLYFPGLGFEILLHLASVLAVMWFFRTDLAGLGAGGFRYVVRRSEADRTAFCFVMYMLVATTITGVLGIFLKSAIGEAVKSPPVVSGGLVLTGLFLILVERVRRYGERNAAGMLWTDGVWVGLAQTLAVLPGISRSGASLIPALWLGLERETAVRFAFLLAIPVILGSSVLAVEDLHGGMFAEIGWGPLAVSFVVTFFFSLVGIYWLIAFLRRSRLIYFAIYCLILAVFVFVYFDPDDVIDVPETPPELGEWAESVPGEFSQGGFVERTAPVRSGR